MKNKNVKSFGEFNESVFSDQGHAGMNGERYEDEKVYSEEEVIELLLKFNNDKPGSFDASEWFEQNKK